MKFLITILIAILSLAGVAYAQDFEVDVSMPEADVRVTLDDIRYTIKAIVPEMKQRLESYLQSLGMTIADLEETLDNPTEDIKQTFGPSGITISEIKKMINTLPEPVIQMFHSEKEL